MGGVWAQNLTYMCFTLNVTSITYLLFYIYLQPFIQLGLLYYKTRGATMSALAVLKVKGVNY